MPEPVARGLRPGAPPFYGPAETDGGASTNGIVPYSGRPRLRSVTAHRIVGGGLGRRYDQAARLSEFAFSGSSAVARGSHGSAVRVGGPGPAEVRVARRRSGIEERAGSGARAPPGGSQPRGDYRNDDRIGDRPDGDGDGENNIDGNGDAHDDNGSRNVIDTARERRPRLLQAPPPPPPPPPLPPPPPRAGRRARGEGAAVEMFNAVDVPRNAPQVAVYGQAPAAAQDMEGPHRPRYGAQGEVRGDHPQAVVQQQSDETRSEVGSPEAAGDACDAAGTDGGRLRRRRLLSSGETMVLSNLCLEAMVDAWESHGTVYVPRAYHMPHELCARLLRLLVASKKLTAFSLSGFLSPAALELDLSGCSYVPKSVFKQLGFSCPRLIHLNLSMCSQVNNAVVRSVLQGCSALRQLYLDGCRHVTDAGFHLEQSPFYVLLGAVSLETISVQGCPQVTGELVLHLRKICRNLKELDLARCKSVDSVSVRTVFDSCPSLQSLNISFLDGVVDKAFEGLPMLQFRESRTMQHPSSQAGVGSGGENSHIFTPINTRESMSPMTEVTTPKISTPTSSLPDLRHLNLGRCRGVTDLALARVAGGFPHLEGLHLEHCLRVTDVGVRALSLGCGAGLRALGLRNCGQITDRALEALSVHCPSLEWLDFSWCGQITDLGVARLAKGCSSLQEVQAVWCEGLTDASLSALWTSCLHLEVVHIEGCEGITSSAAMCLRGAGVEVFQ